jgi:very-short-patch-repair endonuclease
MTLSQAQLEQRRAAGRARAKAFNSAYQVAARAQQSHESLAARGRKGFAALVRKHGKDKALEHLAEYRREHPTEIERRVAAWLDAHHVAYRREASVAGVYVDFLLDDGTTVLECDGAIWHANDPLHGQDRAGRDALHEMALAANGYRLIRLPEAAILDGSAFVQLEQQL